MRKRVWMTALPSLWIALAGCGGTEPAQLQSSLEDLTDDQKDDGANAGDPSDDKDPGDHKDPGDGKDCGGTDPGAPPALCSDKGFACAVIVDKEHLCSEGLEPHWDLACGENEVCCGTPIEAGDPGDGTKPDEPKDEPGK